MTHAEKRKSSTETASQASSTEPAVVKETVEISPVSANGVGAVLSGVGLAICIIVAYAAVGFDSQYEANRIALEYKDYPAGDISFPFDWLAHYVKALVRTLICIAGWLVGTCLCAAGGTTGLVSYLRVRDGQAEFAMIAGALGPILLAGTFWWLYG